MANPSIAPSRDHLLWLPGLQTAIITVDKTTDTALPLFFTNIQATVGGFSPSITTQPFGESGGSGTWTIPSLNGVWTAINSIGPTPYNVFEDNQGITSGSFLSNGTTSFLPQNTTFTFDVKMLVSVASFNGCAGECPWRFAGTWGSITYPPPSYRAAPASTVFWCPFTFQLITTDFKNGGTFYGGAQSLINMWSSYFICADGPNCQLAIDIPNNNAPGSMFSNGNFGYSGTVNIQLK